MGSGEALAASAPVAGGGWLFRHRSWLPVPLALILVGVRWGSVAHPAIFVVGPLLVLCGEAVRWWGVGQIGVISRTRTTRLGPLITSGPFALCRNPLYVGNLLLWAGFTVWSGLLWMLPATLGVFGGYYASIIGWEEALLTERFGEDYRRYCAETPRWLPRLGRWGRAASSGAMHGWREVAFSERGTLIAIVVGGLLLILRQRFWMP
jgi:protein-S-isoprenylcysteine O-methyltransferase Ste14